MKQHAIHCHYVSESLATPWETRFRELHFYDFSSRRIDRLPSKTLFARRGLSSRAGEDWLDEMIETPLGRFRQQVRKRTGPVATEIDDLAAYRALLLLVPLQVTRAAKVASGGARLDEIFDWPQPKLDDFLLALRSAYSLHIVQAHPRSPLFFTEHGFFMLPFPGASHEDAAAPAIALNECEAVVALPRSMDRDVVAHNLKRGDGSYVNDCSIGTNANRVVIHPDVVEAMDHDELIADIEAARARNREWFRVSLQCVHLTLQAVAGMGTG